MPSAKHCPTPVAVQSCHQLLAWMLPKIDQFPRVRRFTLGERIESGLLQVLEWLIEASYSQRKKAALAQANHRLAVIKHLWRLALELTVISLITYQAGVEQLLHRPEVALFALDLEEN